MFEMMVPVQLTPQCNSKLYCMPNLFFNATTNQLKLDMKREKQEYLPSQFGIHKHALTDNIMADN